MSTNVEGLQKQIGELKEQLYAALRAQPRHAVADAMLSRDDSSPVRLSELFRGKPDLILIHNMGRKCRYCTLWADGFNGLAAHLADRAGFALCSPDEPAAVREFALSRGWKFQCVSAAGTTFIKDMGFEPKPGDHHPGISTFQRTAGGAIVRVASAPLGPMDDFCALWPMLHMLADGVGGWEPKYKYA
ncbi:MAG: DUF899 family protein [Phycisphaerales bacterium]